MEAWRWLGVFEELFPKYRDYPERCSHRNRLALTHLCSDIRYGKQHSIERPSLKGLCSDW
ncbi:MAG: hypothetical protein ACKVHG_09560 [Sphingomonadales bacterium]